MRKQPTVQLRGSVKIDTVVVLEILANERGKRIGETLEALLHESDTFRKKLEELLSFKGKI
ncbi:hypothetical protein [Hydrogenimonas sp.]